MEYSEKLGLRAIAAGVGFLVGGPVLAAVAWKGTAVATSGSLAAAGAHLIPFGGLAADGAGLAAEFGDVVDSADLTVHGTSDVTDIHGNYPSDIHGNAQGRLGNGNLPQDGWGRPKI